MPEMDGLAATRAIRARGDGGSTTPIIAFTGNAFAEDVQACRDSGMDGFLAKPVGKEALCDAILKVLAKNSMPAARLSDPNRNEHADAEGDPAVIDA